MTQNPEVSTPAEKAHYHCGYLPVKPATLIPRRSVSKDGPVPALIRGGRWDLATWLLLVSSATPSHAMVELRYYRLFGSRCLGLPDDDTGTTLRSTISRTLNRLEDLKLISFQQKKQGQVIIRIRSLDGDGNAYEMPRPSQTKVIRVPTGPLFQNGWHMRLSQAELGALLISMTEESYQFNKFGQHQWEKSRDAISRDYGIAASTWSKAKEGLHEVGLLEWDMPQLRRRSRMLEVPTDRYTVHSEVLEIDAATAPTYGSFTMPITLTAPGTGTKLRLHRHKRIRKAENKVVPLRRPGRDA